MPQAMQPLGETISDRQKWLILGSCLLTLFVTALDQTVVSTATPKIVADLGGFNLLSWLFTSYMLSSTVIVPLCGKLSDVYGRKTFLIGGNLIFTIASLACGLATTMPQLIIFRAVQGIGGGMIMSAVFATTGDLFPPAQRVKYMGLFTGTFGLASILGPATGGFLTDNANWRWVFFINIPITAIAIPAVWYNLPMRRAATKPKIDYLGAFLLSVATLTLLFAMVWAGDKYAWSSPQIIGLLSAAVVFTGLFIAREARFSDPIIPLFLFKNRAFLVANLTVLILGLGMFGALQFLGIFVQTALGFSATSSGVISTPQSLGMLVASTIGGQLISRTGKYKYQTIFGSVLVAGAMVMLMRLDLDTTRVQISSAMVLLGLGFGLMMPTMSMMSQNSVDHQHIGVATSVNQFGRQIGSVLGIALFGALLSNSYSSTFQDELGAQNLSTLGPELVQKLDDPTLSLNPVEFRKVRTQIEALPGGSEILSAALQAQKAGVTAGVQDIYFIAFLASLAGIALSLLMKEVPLRRTFGAAPAAPPAGGKPGESSVEAARPAPAPEGAMGGH